IGWFNHLEKSIKDAQQIFDPLAIAKTQNGLEILEGNHRAWFAYQYNLYVPAWIFESYCELCTEDQFTSDMFEKTKEIGGLYGQQGFEVNMLLVGPWCAGKTTIGKELAERLKVPFIDIDDLTEHYGAELNWSVHDLIELNSTMGMLASESEWERIRVHA